MKIHDIVTSVCAQYRQEPHLRLPFYVEGPPGIGKTDVGKGAAKTLAQDTGRKFRDLSHRSPGDFDIGDGDFCHLPLTATIEDPITLSGLPVRALGEVNAMGERAPLDFAEFLPFRDKLPTRGAGMLVIDDLPTAPPAVQAGFFSLFLDRRLGSYMLPDSWYVMATGNRDIDRAATNRIPSPLWSRWVRLVAECDVDGWVRWASGNGVRPEVLAFLKYKPDLIMDFEPDKPGPYACPRSWVFASRLLDTATKANEMELFKGCIGEGAAIELETFLRTFRSLVTPEEILANPTGARLPDGTQIDAMYSVTLALAHVTTAKNLPAALTYMERCTASTGAKEFEVLFMRSASERDSSMIPTFAFLDWSKRNREIVL